jgi:hypothetical protein
MGAGNRNGEDSAVVSRLALPLRVKRLGGELAIGFLEEDFYAAFRFFQLFLTFTRQRYAFFKQLHGVVQRKLRAFQAADDFFQARKGTLEIWLLRWLRFFGSR